MVDDDPSVRALVRALLPGTFDPIWEASDGSEALDQAYRHQPDLVILDYALPKLDGEAVARGFRVLAPKARVLVLSAVLEGPPKWGDAFLAKDDIDLLPGFLETFFGRGGR